MRQKQECEHLNLPKGVEHLDECVCVKNENDEDVKADIELPKNNEIKMLTLMITENNVNDALKILIDSTTATLISFKSSPSFTIGFIKNNNHDSLDVIVEYCNSYNNH